MLNDYKIATRNSLLSFGTTVGESRWPIGPPHSIPSFQGLRGVLGLHDLANPDYIRSKLVALIDQASNSSKWTTKHFLMHYMFGRGATVDLAKVGLGLDFQNAPTVSTATQGFIDSTIKQVNCEIKEQKNTAVPGPPVVITDTKVTDVTNVGVVDVTGLPALFSVGNSLLNMLATCIDGTCTFVFEINDEFVDALDIYDSWEGNLDVPFSSPYPIHYKWSVTQALC